MSRKLQLSDQSLLELIANSDKNNIQRLTNSSLTQPDMILAPLYNPVSGQVINAFPPTIKHVTRLTG